MIPFDINLVLFLILGRRCMETMERRRRESFPRLSGKDVTSANAGRKKKT